MAVTFVWRVNSRRNYMYICNKIREEEMDSGLLNPEQWTKRYRELLKEYALDPDPM